MANAGQFKKGEKRPGQSPGRPKGREENSTRTIREMIQKALDNAGGVDYLVERAHDPKTASAFLTLVGKVLPLQVTGEDGGPVKAVHRIEIVALGK